MISFKALRQLLKSLYDFIRERDMKLATVKIRETEGVCVITSFGLVPMESINRKFNRSWPCDMQSLIQTGELEMFRKWFCSI